MKRVIIIGCSGSGKSTLAKLLGQALGLPVHHLDAIYWRPGWQETPPDEGDTSVQELCTQPQWIIDGNFGRTMELRLAACDTVIFLDLPTRSCLWGVIRRYWQYRGRTRPDMTSGCPEKLDGEFIRWILGFRRKSRPQILERLRQAEGLKRIVTLTSRAAIRRFLTEIEASAQATVNPR